MAKYSEESIPSGKQEVECWSIQDKFLIVIETSLLNEVELFEYCHSKGVNVEQVQAWRDACMQAIESVTKQASSLQRKLRKKDRVIRKMEQELRRYEAAFGEIATLWEQSKIANNAKKLI